MMSAMGLLRRHQPSRLNQAGAMPTAFAWAWELPPPGRRAVLRIEWNYTLTPSDHATLVKIAPMTTPATIVSVIGTAVLLRDHVLEMELEARTAESGRW